MPFSKVFLLKLKFIVVICDCYIQGYLVGNGVTDEEIDGNALVPFVHGMGLISNDLYEVGGATDEAFSF